ncbi:oxaloacetate decarboxylase gamma chain [Clostridium sp. CAG:510]|jgi:sodium pump decarboxylase gamma subunit|nr:oxaloacetate decarboxylase gamma chain [Clostridium sp. CAG:510]
MKKFLTMLCMLTCVLGLTACGEYEPTEMEQQKGNEAVSMATNFILPYMTSFFDDELVEAVQENYNVHEVESQVEDYFSLYISMVSQNYNISFGYDSIDVEGNAILTGMVSFNNTYDELGDIKTSEGFQGTYKVSGDEIIVSVPVTGTKTDSNGNVRTATAELIFTNDIFLTLKSCALNLDQSMGELMAKAAMDTLMGMMTVFAVLILISIIIWAMGGIPKLQAKLAKKPESKKEESIDNTIAQIVEKEESTEDDTELVAVIAAAIAAYEGSQSTDGFVVRSIRKRR